MKKLILLTLSLALITGAFAQTTTTRTKLTNLTTIPLSGTVYKVFERDTLYFRLDWKDRSTPASDSVIVTKKLYRLKKQVHAIAAPVVAPPTVYNGTSTFTANCSFGYTGNPQTATATATSTISQADANSKAATLAQQKAIAALKCSIIPPPPQSDATEFNTHTAQGSMTKGANTLTVSADLQVQPGDFIIVHLGGETGAGMRGTIGVGGQFPYLKTYNTLALMNADTTQVEDIYVGNLEDGKIYRYLKSNGWQPYTKWGADKIFPIPLRAQVVSISTDKKTLYLSDTAQANTVNADVSVDCSPILTKLAVAGATINLPTNAMLSLGAVTAIVNKANLTIHGNGATIYSPWGSPSASLQFHNCTGGSIDGVTIKANGNYNGIGFNWTKPVEDPYYPDDYPPVLNESWSNPFIRVPALLMASNNFTVRDSKIIDPVGYAFQINGNNTHGINLQVQVTQNSLKEYSGWPGYHIYGCSNSSFDSISFTAPTTMRAVECSQTTDCTVSHFSITNGLFGFNQQVRSHLIHGTQTLTRYSVGPEVSSNPMVDVNQFLSGDNQAGLFFEDFHMVQQWYVGQDSLCLNGIYCREGAKGISVINCTFDRPNTFGNTKAMALHIDDGAGSYVDGLVCTGNLPPGWAEGDVNGDAANIGIKGTGPGTVKNCSAQVIIVPAGYTRQNNTCTRCQQ